MSNDSLMTVPEVAEFLRVARSSVYVLERRYPASPRKSADIC